MNARRVVLYTVLVIAVLLGIYLIYLIRDILILIFVAILLATAIAPLVDRLRSLIGAGQAVLIIYLGIAAGLGALFYFVVLVLIEQMATLLTNLPKYLADLEGFVKTINMPLLRETLLQLLNEASKAISSGQPGATTGVIQGAFTITISLFTFAFAFFTVLVMAYYWITDRASILRLFISFFPAEKRAQAYAIWEEIERKLGSWVRAEIILMGIIAAMAAAGYTAMGLKFALLLAVIAGLMEIVPIIGPWLGSAPAVLVALTQSFWLAVAVAIYAAVIQTIEGNVLVPRIMGGTTGVNPLVVIIALLIGVTLMGIPGALLAVPVASAIKVLIEALVLERPPLGGGTTSRPDRP